MSSYKADDASSSRYVCMYVCMYAYAYEHQRQLVTCNQDRLVYTHTNTYTHTRALTQTHTIFWYISEACSTQQDCNQVEIATVCCFYSCLHPT